MSTLAYTKVEFLPLRDHPGLNERCLQARIAEDPSILDLGELILKDKERHHTRAGRLDLRLQDPETLVSDEAEAQLGQTDEAPVIRTIEYWDVRESRAGSSLRHQSNAELTRICIGESLEIDAMWQFRNAAIFANPKTDGLS